MLIFFLLIAATNAQFLIRTAQKGQFCGETVVNKNNQTYYAYVGCSNGLLCDVDSTCKLYYREPFERCENSVQCTNGLKCQVHFDGILRCGGAYNINFFKPYGLYQRKSPVTTQSCSQTCRNQFLAFVGDGCVCVSDIGEVATTKLFDSTYENALNSAICDSLPRYSFVSLENTSGDLPTFPCQYWTSSQSDQIFLYKMVTMEEDSVGDGNANFGMSESDQFHFIGYFNKKDIAGSAEYCIRRKYSDACKCDVVCKNNVFMGISDVALHGNYATQTCLCGDKINEIVSVSNALSEYVPVCDNTPFLTIMDTYNIGKPAVQANMCESNYAWGDEQSQVVAVYKKLQVSDQTLVDHSLKSTATVVLAIVCSIIGCVLLLYMWSQISDVDYDEKV